MLWSMSNVNKVLRELDQRHAVAESLEGTPREVRTEPDAIPGHEWFWRILAVLLFIALAWVGWVYYQIYPRRIVTDLGIAAGERARQNALRSPETTVATPPAAEPAVASATVSTTELAGLRLAESIVTPITESAPPQQNELTPATVERAEAEFRRGAALLQQGRMSEAESRFALAIVLDPAHERARQALAARLVEQRQLEDARRLLQEGLRINPRQQQFAIALARIYIERADYPTALDVLNSGRNDAQPSAEYDAVLGSVLSRMGRDREAVEAYRAALRVAPDNGGSWLGLALSLENLDRRAEAADASRRALASGTLTADVRQYAEQKIRALR